jgi:glycolate oxidase FAD binding subunit
VSVIDALMDACGEQHVRLASTGDVVGGTPARWVASPGTEDEVSAVLRVATREDFTVATAGAGTKLDWGMPPTRVDLILETGRLVEVFEHDPAASQARVGAGFRLRGIRARLTPAGQRLALDVPSAAATLGGVLAADEAGPLRMTYGQPRDVVSDLRFVTADGSVVTASETVAAGIGGRDVARSMCGSLGTLGVIVDATVRLHRTPEARVWVLRPVGGRRELQELVAALRASSFEPAAIEVDLPRTPLAELRAGDLAVLVEGSRAGARSRADAIARIVGGGATVADTPPPWWGRYPFSAGDLALKVSAHPEELFSVVLALRDASGMVVPVRGSAGAGVVFAALPVSTTPQRLSGVLTAVRTILLARGGGTCEVVRAPADIRAATVDMTEPSPERDRVRRLKAQLDPHNRFVPGR